MRHRRLFFMLSFCLLMAGSVAGQEKATTSGQITGRLTDSISSQPLQYATVALFKQGQDQPVQGVVTDEAGSFNFSNLGLGKYELLASYVGYAPRRIPSVIITEDEQSRRIGAVPLGPDETQLDEVNIRSLRPRSIIDQSIIDSLVI